MLYLYTDYVDDINMRFQIGWYFIGVALSNIIINWLVIVSKVIKMSVSTIEHKIVDWKIQHPRII
jgi:hypothetical protein